jgi:hypothetical protein
MRVTPGSRVGIRRLKRPRWGSGEGEEEVNRLGIFPLRVIGHMGFIGLSLDCDCFIFSQFPSRLFSLHLSYFLYLFFTLISRLIGTYTRQLLPTQPSLSSSPSSCAEKHRISVI